jgi:hypothetical protein
VNVPDEVNEWIKLKVLGSNTIVPPVANAEPVYKLPEELKVWIVLPA